MRSGDPIEEILGPIPEILGHPAIRQASQDACESAKRRHRPEQRNLPSAEDLVRSLMPSLKEVNSESDLAASGRRLGVAIDMIGIKHVALGMEVGINKDAENAICKICRGDRPIPSRKLDAYARTLHVPNQWLASRGPYSWWSDARILDPAAQATKQVLHSRGIPLWAMPWATWILSEIAKVRIHFTFSDRPMYPQYKDSRLVFIQGKPSKEGSGITAKTKVSPE